MDRDTDSDGGAGPGTEPTLPIAAANEPIGPGALIGDRYRIVRWLGRGGMGSVYEVDDCELGVRVALKMAEGAGWSPRAVGQLKREIQLARRVTHPNVCRVHDFGMHVVESGAGTPFLTMELIEGRTLAAELAEQGRLDADRTLARAEAMAAALDAAHAAGVVHRDFKTGNVMLAGDRTIVTDFGLALDAATDTAATNALVGSPAYMAPEQVVGGAITVATDIYAFGVVLYELLTGRLPFEGETALATAVRRLGTPPPSMRGVVPGLPARWEEAILRCLRLPQHERFDTCADVVRELRSASPTTRSYSPRGSERRKVALVLADDPRDGVAFQELMRQHGGTSVTLAQARMAAVFGAEQSLGDEIDRALAAAHAAALAADCVALSIGHASLQGGSLEGDALREAQAACERRHGGVVAGAQTATRLTTRCEIVEVEPGLFALGPLRRVASASLVGREAELSALRRARDAVLAEGRGLATWILGPPGTGKSRLAEAAIGIALDEGMGVWSARASAHDPHAYGLFARPSDAATEESRSARALSAGDASVARLSQTMGRGPDPRAMADRARARALARLGELAEAGPFALVLDDLQWADPSSLALVSELALVLEGKAVWLVLAARDELVEAHPELLESVDSTGRIDPSPLRAADVAALAIARTGARASPAIAQALADRAGGNPLFVEQLLDVLDPRDLQGDAIAEWPLPASIELAVQARLDQLPGLERECVERLSVHGRAASAAQLETLGGGSLREALASLGRRGLVVRVAAEGGALRPRSPLIGEVAYRMIEEGRRRELHLAAARAAIAAGRDSVEVGRHWAAAGETRRAAAAYLRATLEHAVRGDSPGVLRCAARALELGVDVEDAFTLQFVRAEAAWFAGDPALQRATLDEAWDAAQSDRDRALVACERGEWLRRNRRPEEALEELRRAVELAGASGDEDTRARALGRLASALAALGRTDEAQQALRSIDSAALGVTTRAIVEDVRGWVAGHVGDLALVRVAYASAAALYAEAGDLRRAAGAESNLADASNRLGRYAEAERALRRALELARKVGNRLTEGYALMNLGFALCESGRHDEAARTLAEAVRIARVTRDARVEIGSRLYGARASLWAGHAVAAADLERLAEEASGDVMLQANAWALAARAWLACGDARRASESAARALALLEERGAIEEGEGDVFWAAVLAFEAVEQSARAAGVRARGRQRVLDLAARITDGDARRSFLEDVAAHRFLTA